MEHLRPIDRLDAVRTVADPHRMEILRLLLARPHTLSSLGRELGKHPAWVRHHVHALESVGLVKLQEERTTANYTERFYTASAAAFTISLAIRPEARERRSLLALVSHDFAMELLASSDERATDLSIGVAGSLDGLIGVRQGLADIAGCHLLDADTGTYNVPYAKHLFPDRDTVVVTLAHRDQGLILPPGNPLRIKEFKDIAEKNARLANRNRGSGTRMWIDRALASCGIEPSQVAGYVDEVDTHTAAAKLVASGDADVAVGIAAAAQAQGLEFVPLFHERYDLIMPEEVYRTVEAERLISVLHTKAFRQSVERIRGYDATDMGDEYHLGV